MNNRQLEDEVLEYFAEAIKNPRIDGEYIFHHFVGDLFIKENESVLMYAKLAKMIAPVVKPYMKESEYSEYMEELNDIKMGGYELDLTGNNVIAIRALCEFMLDDFHEEEATLIARMACSFNKKNPSLLTLLGSCKYALGFKNFDENKRNEAVICLTDARHYFNEALKINPDNFEAVFSLGQTYLMLGPVERGNLDDIYREDFEEALPFYEIAHDLRPNSHSIYLLLADAYSKTGRRREAVTLLSNKLTEGHLKMESSKLIQESGEIQGLANNILLSEEDPEKRLMLEDLFYFNLRVKMPNERVH